MKRVLFIILILAGTAFRYTDTDGAKRASEVCAVCAIDMVLLVGVAGFFLHLENERIIVMDEKHIFIIALSHQHALKWAMNHGLRATEWTYISDPAKLFNLSEIKYTFLANWHANNAARSIQATMQGVKNQRFTEVPEDEVMSVVFDREDIEHESEA